MDCNPAQSALLELKTVAIRQLGFEDVWALFGEGKVRPSRERWGGGLPVEPGWPRRAVSAVKATLVAVP